jgi:hypothetical protein
MEVVSTGSPVEFQLTWEDVDNLFLGLAPFFRQSQRLNIYSFSSGSTSTLMRSQILSLLCSKRIADLCHMDVESWSLKSDHFLLYRFQRLRRQLVTQKAQVAISDLAA